jgi:hypothetical protein
MNANYGLFPETAGRERGRERRQQMAARALRDGESWLRQHDLTARLTESMPLPSPSSPHLSAE